MDMCIGLSMDSEASESWEPQGKASVEKTAACKADKAV